MSLHRAWRAMISRCKDPSHKSFANYGGRGITVCDRWLDFDTFQADMGERPLGKTLERSDNNVGYSPDNCRWATAREQSRNRRSVRQVTFNGETLPLPTWADRIGITVRALRQRLDAGWSTERALTRPGGLNGKAKLSEADVLDIRRRLATGEKQAALGREFGVARGSITEIAKGRTWRSLTIEHFDDASSEAAPGARQPNKLAGGVPA